VVLAPQLGTRDGVDGDHPRVRAVVLVQGHVPYETEIARGVLWIEASIREMRARRIGHG
jgi:hypothetical protein